MPERSKKRPRDPNQGAVGKEMRKLTKREAVYEKIFMRLLGQHLDLQLEMRILRHILEEKGIVSFAEFTEAEATVRRLDKELDERAGQSKSELLADLLLQFQGPAQ
jgi:hypothetical protein